MAIEVLVPPLGQTVDTVTLIAWYREEGETVTQGEMLFAIETDKATLDIEAPGSGVLRQMTAQPGDQIQVLSAIALIAEPDEMLPEAPSLPGSKPALQEWAPTLPARQSLGDEWPRKVDSRIFVSPRARRVAEEHDISLTMVKPTGPEGAIVERDVLAYLAGKHKPTIAPVAHPVDDAARLDPSALPGGGAIGISHTLSETDAIETIPMHGVRAVVAEHMHRSATITASVTLNAEADATSLVDLRHRLLQEGVDVSYNDLLLYILGQALQDHPRLNSTLAGDTIKQWKPIHIGLAVDTHRGLLVPVVRDVHRKGLLKLAQETRRLVQRARCGQCTPEELDGGTFTLTNLGMFGIDSFTPIINLPQCAILGVGRIKKRPAVLRDRIVARDMMWLSLTIDHRLVDGAPAARFLQQVVRLIEHPSLLLVRYLAAP